MEELTPTEGPAAIAELSDDGASPIIRLRGQLDISSVEQIRPIFDKVAGLRPERVVIDMSGLEFMDSSGIALLLILAYQVGRVELRNPTSIVRAVIEMTGLADTLVIQP